MNGGVSLKKYVRGCVSLNKYKSQGKAVEVPVNSKEGKLFRLSFGFCPRIWPLYVWLCGGWPKRPCICRHPYISPPIHFFLVSYVRWTMQSLDNAFLERRCGVSYSSSFYVHCSIACSQS
jgi:hypothetical protein